MAARSTMRHRCTIERNQGAADSSWGGEGIPDWQPHLTAQPCHFWFRAGRQAIDGAKTAVVEDQRLLVPLGTDVTANDRVNELTDRLGNSLLAGPILIDTVGKRADHLVLYLKEIA